MALYDAPYSADNASHALSPYSLVNVLTKLTLCLRPFDWSWLPLTTIQSEAFSAGQIYIFMLRRKSARLSAGPKNNWLAVYHLYYCFRISTLFKR
jgi:hypothetical protein